MLILLATFFISSILPIRCELDGWKGLGCWRDLPTRAIASLEGKSRLLGDNWKTRKDPLSACAQAATDEKLKVFAVQDSGQCFGGPYAQMFYDQYGPSNLCQGGVGGVWSNNVYSAKTAYARVLESKREEQKQIKCSKPLDLVFLVDGSGPSNIENKLRWDQMMKFVSKATEEFDSPSTRFGVISIGSSPKVIVNITDNKDDLSMRETILNTDFPGGRRNINDALQKAWKEQLKVTERERNKVIVAMTTGNMDYGPWGSSLFLTKRGIRLLAFGIDRVPSYRFLETLASGKHPENIYSVDSEQLDATLPFFAKDICTGLKKGRIETVRKDKEIDFVPGQEFQTTGSVVERKSEKSENASSASNENQEGTDEKSNKELNDGREGESREGYSKKEKPESGKKMNENDEMLMGSYEKMKNDEENESDMVKLGSELMHASNETEALKAATPIKPVNNSTMSDGDIVEKLKESALEKLKSAKKAESAENLKSFADIDEPSKKDDSFDKNSTLMEEKINTAKSNATMSEKYNENRSNTNSSSRLSDKLNGKEKSTTGKGFLKSGPTLERNATLANLTEAEKQAQSKATSNDGMKKVPNKKIAASSGAKESGVERSKGQMSEGQMAKEGKAANRHGQQAGNKQKSAKAENASQNISRKVDQRNETAHENITSQFGSEKGFDERTHENETKGYEDKEKKDMDKEIFMELQHERESIGQVKKGNDDTVSNNSNTDTSSYSYGNKTTSDDGLASESLPDDESTIDEDEKATKDALELKRHEIDILLKKLDEKRQKRRRRKVKKNAKTSKDASENFDENETSINLNKRKNGDIDDDMNFDNGMESGKTLRRLKDEYSRPYARHTLLISQNDSKPFPVQRPFRTIPTKKALKLLDKLYSYHNKPKLSLSYDIFDPTYSSKSSKTLTKSSYRKLVKNAGEPGLENQSEKTHKKHAEKVQKAPLKARDKQHFFLRNMISEKSSNDNNRMERKTSHWHYESPRKKFSIKGVTSKQASKTATAKNATIDIKKALDDYYSYFLSHMPSVWHHADGKSKMPYLNSSSVTPYYTAPIWNYVNGKPKMPYLSSSSAGSHRLETTGQRRDAMQSNSTHLTYANDTNVSLRRSSSSENMGGRNMTSELKAERTKTVQGISRSFITSSKSEEFHPKSINLRTPLSFKSLPSIDSGNYTIYRFGKKSILISLQSKSGELKSFYGEMSSKPRRRRKRRRFLRTRKQILLGLARNESVGRAKRPAEGSLHHRGRIAGKLHHRRKAMRFRASKPTKYVDNMQYFQSSLQNEPGSTRTYKKLKIKKKTHRQRNAKKHSEVETSMTDANANRTAYDVFDNRLAHVEKQRQYFMKDKTEPDRLIITENSDPITDSSTVKLFLNAGDENSLIPAESKGLSSHDDGKRKSLMYDLSDDSKGKWEKFIESGEDEEDGNKYDNVSKEDDVNKESKSGEGKDKKIKSKGKTKESAKENEQFRSESSKTELKKIVEESSNSSEKEASGNEGQNKDKKENEVRKTDGNEKNKGKISSMKDSNGKKENKSESGKEVKDEKMNEVSKDQKTKENKKEDEASSKKGKKDEDVWVFKPDANKETKNEVQKNQTNKNDEKENRNETSITQNSKMVQEKNESNYKDESAKSDGELVSQLGQAVGCTRPVKVLYLIDVSDAIGTGPTRQRKWNHMKRFLQSVNDKVTHGGNMGYIVYDIEPRYLSQLSPCDEKTEYFVTSGECLCDRRAASFHEGKSTCSTHAPTEEENLEDWGKQGPRTAKALELAQKIFQNESTSDLKKLVVLVTHQASTDDVTGAERSLKDDSISLVDIEIGERHNIKKRSNKFDDVIPRDHQMEVSFHKLDNAIENIFMKICKEKDPTKSRRSRIFASMRSRRNWW